MHVAPHSSPCMSLLSNADDLVGLPITDWSAQWNLSPVAAMNHLRDRAESPNQFGATLGRPWLSVG